MTISANDNITIKDGNNSQVTMRAKDYSALGNGTQQIIRHLSTLYPVDYGYLGCRQYTAKSGIMAAGLAAASPIFSTFNQNQAIQHIIRRMTFNAWTLGVGFPSNSLVNFELYFARSYNVVDTGGNVANFTNHNASLASFMGGIATTITYSTTGALTVGTRTLDFAPITAINAVAPTTTNTPFFGNGFPLGAPLFDKQGSNHPIVTGLNEGIIVNATVPGTGTWAYAMTIEWDEVPSQNY